MFSSSTNLSFESLKISFLSKLKIFSLINEIFFFNLFFKYIDTGSSESSLTILPLGLPI